MSSPRLRRLKLDHERLENRFRDWPAVQFSARAGLPPEQYQVTYTVKGLYATPDGRVLERGQHVMEISLSLAYPRRAPQCKMLTPIFHPNFDEASVCIGDFWAASEGLDDLIIRIGRMIAYQEYNTKSPLNGLAAKWADQHAALLPVDARDIAPPSEHNPSAFDETVVVRLDEDAPDLGEPRPSQPRLDFGMIVVTLGDGLTTIGRADSNTLQILRTSLSQHHAEIVGGEMILRDLGSTNGTTVNGAPIAEHALRHGDEIHFGGLGATFLTELTVPIADRATA